MFDFASFEWWYALLIFGVANAISAAPAGLGGDFTYYNEFRKPRLAPPDWIFAPVWLVLNITSLIALYRVANLAERPTEWVIFLWAEFAGWILFAAFTSLFFLFRSPKLAAVDTVAGLVAAMISVYCAMALDGISAALIFLRVIWLGLATYVSVYIAVKN